MLYLGRGGQNDKHKTKYTKGSNKASSIFYNIKLYSVISQ